MQWMAPTQTWSPMGLRQAPDLASVAVWRFSQGLRFVPLLRLISIRPITRVGGARQRFSPDILGRPMQVQRARNYLAETDVIGQRLTLEIDRTAMRRLVENWSRVIRDPH